MGSSGSGKSTFLNFLTRNIIDLKCQGNLFSNFCQGKFWNNYKNRILGEVRINGLDIGKRISKIAGYVRQDDIFLGEITVMEHLNFRARLVLHPDNFDAKNLLKVFSETYSSKIIVFRMTCKHLSATERDSKIMKILEQFELTHSAHVAIGTPGNFLKTCFCFKLKNWMVV